METGHGEEGGGGERGGGKEWVREAQQRAGGHASETR